MKLKNQKKRGHMFPFSKIERKEWRKKKETIGKDKPLIIHLNTLNQ